MDRRDTSGFVSGGVGVSWLELLHICFSCSYKDGTSCRCSPTSTLNDSSILNEAFQDGPTHSKVASLRLEANSISCPFLSHPPGSKWISGASDDGPVGLLDGSSLYLELGPSLSSFESSLSMELPNFNPHIRNATSPELPKISCSAPNLKLLGCKLDLELNLSIGATESDVTCITPSSCITPGFASFRNSIGMPVMDGTVQLLDEGSTSSRSKCWPMLPPLQNTHMETMLSAFDHVFKNRNPNPTLNLSLTMPRGPQRPVMTVRTCQVKGCGKGARGASGRCIAHGGGCRCQKPGCQKGAEGNTVFCKAHGGGRRCHYLGCTKSAEGRTDCCIAHGGGKRCSHEGCSRAARGKSGLCIRHGGGKRCKVQNCMRSAEGILGLCISHGGGRRCEYPACTKGAQGRTMLCKAHGGGKRCAAPGCRKGAEGSTQFCKGHGGGKRCTFQGGGVCSKSVHGGTLFCVAHGGGKRCAVPECTKSARGRTACCVLHGGGKRCKYVGCGKGAQGSTDFCKAHGGGKRCSWGQMQSEIVGGQVAQPCDKFARGKTGLCAAHTARVQDNQASDMIPVNRRNLIDLNTFELGEYGHSLDNFVAGKGPAMQFLLPEGRVHGGGLMAMLRSGTVPGWIEP